MEARARRQDGFGTLLFIDEIHRLPKTVEEFMYPAMEDFRIDITVGEGISARTVNMSLRPFTLIEIGRASCRERV